MLAAEKNEANTEAGAMAEEQGITRSGESLGAALVDALAAPPHATMGLCASRPSAAGPRSINPSGAGGRLCKRAVAVLGVFLQERKEQSAAAKADTRVVRESALQRLVEGGWEDVRPL